MSVALTSGAARSLFASLNDAKAVEADLAHGLIVQLVDFKPLAEGTPKEKYRCGGARLACARRYARPRAPRTAADAREPRTPRAAPQRDAVGRSR